MPSTRLQSVALCSHRRRKIRETRFATVVICVIPWTFPPLRYPAQFLASGIDPVQGVFIFSYVNALACSEDESHMSSICFFERLNAPNMLQAFLYVYSQRDCDPLLLGFFALPDEDVERCFSNSSSYFWWDFADHHVVSQPSPRQMWGHALPYADRLVVTRFALGSHSSLLVVGVFQRSESPLKVYRFLRGKSEHIIPLEAKNIIARHCKSNILLRGCFFHFLVSNTVTTGCVTVWNAADTPTRCLLCCC